MKATVAEKAKEQVCPLPFRVGTGRFRSLPRGPLFQVNPDEMPWQPTPAFKITGKWSILSPYEHNRYVAIVSNFAKAERSLRFRDNAVDLQASPRPAKPCRIPPYFTGMSWLIEFRKWTIDW